MIIPSRRFSTPAPSARLLFIPLLLILAALALVVPSTARAADSGFRSAEITASHFFEPLQHNVANLAGEFADGTPFEANFLENFTQTGGIERWGYPTSAVFEESPGTLTQYYQRGVIDWQPPPGGGDHTFQRRLAWDYLGGGLGGSTDLGVELHLTNPNPGDLLGPWGHKVANTSVEGVPIGFADFFYRLGGVASFGFPKTDARQADHPQAVLHTPGRPVDGRIRQYFQSVVVEYHPESPASPVKLSLLGDTLRDSRYPQSAWQYYLAFGPESPLAVGDHLALGPNRRGLHTATADNSARFLEPSVLRVTTDKACGSGFFVTETGYAVIPWHLAIDAEFVTVSSPRGYSANAHLVAGDVELDLALIKVEGNGHVPVLWDDAENLNPRTELVAVSYDSTSPPEGRGVECRSEPISRSLLTWTVRPGHRPTFVPSISPGNLGGPVATTSGRVVGIAASSSPELPGSDSLLPAREARTLIDRWLDDIVRGDSPAIPIRPLFDRISLVEHASVACPREAFTASRAGNRMAVWVLGSEIDLSTTIWLNPRSQSLALLEFGNTSAGPYEPHDTISFGRSQVWPETEVSTLRWTRYGQGPYGSRTRLKHELHPEVDRGSRVHIGFVYNRGSVALYINGNAVHQEVDLPYEDDITVGLGCTGQSEIENMYFYDVRITGQLIPDA